MSGDGWSRALLAASGVPLAAAQRDDAVRALVMEARAEALARGRVAELAQHRDASVREAIAARADCPLGLQAVLAHDRRGSVRIALAAGGGLAAAIAGVLASDREPAVLKALARNARTPRDVLERLARHRREDVARPARRALEGAAAPPASPALQERQDGPRASSRGEPVSASSRRFDRYRGLGGGYF